MNTTTTTHKCANPSCRTPDAAYSGAKGLCWNCYQQQRRASLPKRRVPACADGHRYHSYNELDNCKHCGTRRIFGG